jgi:hypothetical protein
MKERGWPEHLTEIAKRAMHEEAIIREREISLEIFAILRDLVAKEPEESEFGTCVLCDGLGYEEKEPHDPTCPWLRAKQLLANERS